MPLLIFPEPKIYDASNNCERKLLKKSVRSMGLWPMSNGSPQICALVCGAPVKAHSWARGPCYELPDALLEVHSVHATATPSDHGRAQRHAGQLRRRRAVLRCPR